MSLFFVNGKIIVPIIFKPIATFSYEWRVNWSVRRTLMLKNQTLNKRNNSFHINRWKMTVTSLFEHCSGVAANQNLSFSSTNFFDGFSKDFYIHFSIHTSNIWIKVITYCQTSELIQCNNHPVEWDRKVRSSQTFPRDTISRLLSIFSLGQPRMIFFSSLLRFFK